MIDNPQVTYGFNNYLRPGADRLAQMVHFADSMCQQMMDPEFLTPLGLTLADIAAETLLNVDDEQVDDGRASEGIPLATKRKALALIRIYAQLNALCKATQYGIPEYVKSVAYDLAVNPRG